jgi:trigger factor
MAILGVTKLNAVPPVVFGGFLAGRTRNRPTKSYEQPFASGFSTMSANTTEELSPETTEETPVVEKMQLETQVQQPSACERHLVVTISRDDIGRYFDKAFTELMPSANIPGFRAGRAPRKLVESKFRKDLGDQVKVSLLTDAIAQVIDDGKIAAISEPKFDVEAIKLPDDGPMVFEFDLEVRPDFDMPDWKGLTIERPVKEFSEADVDARLEEMLTRYARLIPFEGAASEGDYITCNLTFKRGDAVLSEAKEEVIRIRPVLSFRDGKIEDFGKLLAGAKAGDVRTGKAKVADDAATAELQGSEVTAEIEVLEVKKLKLPEMTAEFLKDMGFDSEADLREAVLADLKRQLQYHQNRKIRDQVTSLLIVSASWDLPPDLLKRQSRRELERAVMELRRSGFSDADIRAHENELRQSSMKNTARALKEHFILERIAEDETIDAEQPDFDAEIQLIAMQSDESPRRVRARLEKQGLMDVLRNQIIERKVIEKILEFAKFKDVAMESAAAKTEALDKSMSEESSDEEIPEAKYADAGPATTGQGTQTRERD